MISRVSKTSTVARTKDQVWCELAGEAVILNTKSGIYYGLNPVGARVWDLIQEPKAVISLLNTLLEEYEVEPDRCERDLFALLRDLMDNELIEVGAKASGSSQ